LRALEEEHEDEEDEEDFQQTSIKPEEEEILNANVS
jgi:hypothetical protein